VTGRQHQVDTLDGIDRPISGLQVPDSENRFGLGAFGGGSMIGDGTTDHG